MESLPQIWCISLSHVFHYLHWHGKILATNKIFKLTEYCVFSSIYYEFSGQYIYETLVKECFYQYKWKLYIVKPTQNTTQTNSVSQMSWQHFVNALEFFLRKKLEISQYLQVMKFSHMSEEIYWSILQQYTSWTLLSSIPWARFS